jgi:hypothetical protein
MDRWLPAMAIIGPLAGFVIAKIFTFGSIYAGITQDHATIVSIVEWKGKQEDFDRSVIDSIARLQEVTKKIGR